MTIYLAQYNPYIHESAYMTLSAHLSREGAKNAIDEHKKIREKEDDYNAPFEDWDIEEIEVKP